MTLADLWYQTHFNVRDLARLAEVPENVIVGMLRGRPVPLVAARLVLMTLSIMLQKHYNLETIKVPIAELPVSDLCF